MNDRSFFLDPRTGSNLLEKAAGEKVKIFKFFAIKSWLSEGIKNSFPFSQTGGYTVANMIWDLMLARNILPAPSAVEAYYKGLKVKKKSLFSIFKRE